MQISIIFTLIFTPPLSKHSRVDCFASHIWSSSRIGKAYYLNKATLLTIITQPFPIIIIFKQNTISSRRYRANVNHHWRGKLCHFQAENSPERFYLSVVREHADSSRSPPSLPLTLAAWKRAAPRRVEALLLLSAFRGTSRCTHQQSYRICVESVKWLQICRLGPAKLQASGRTRVLRAIHRAFSPSGCRAAYVRDRCRKRVHTRTW